MLIENVVSLSDISESTLDELITVLPETTLLDITGLLSGSKIGMVVVLDDTGKLAGVLSERDIIAAIAEQGADALQSAAREVMTRDVKTCSPRDNPKDVINAMAKGKFRHSPVVDNGQLVGLVSSSDILRHMSETMTSSEQFNIWSKSIWV